MDGWMDERVHNNIQMDRRTGCKHLTRLPGPHNTAEWRKRHSRGHKSASTRCRRLFQSKTFYSSDRRRPSYSRRHAAANTVVVTRAPAWLWLQRLTNFQSL